jgi:hypothetical protein
VKEEALAAMQEKHEEEIAAIKKEHEETKLAIQRVRGIMQRLADDHDEKKKELAALNKAAEEKTAEHHKAMQVCAYRPRDVAHSQVLRDKITGAVAEKTTSEKVGEERLVSTV